MKLYASEDEAYQIRTGHEIVAAYPELYNPWMIQNIKQKLEVRAKTRPDIAGDRTPEKTCLPLLPTTTGSMVSMQPKSSPTSS